MDTLKSFALMKNKYSCSNQIPFMTKNFSEEILTRSRLRNTILKQKPK